MLAGAVGYEQLPVSALPRWITRSFRYSRFIRRGARGDGSSVTSPLERQFGQMPGLKQMTSVSSGGGSVITLEFNLDETSTCRAGSPGGHQCGNSFLPTDLPNPPIYSR